jgi:hypothetical protein
VAGLGLAFSVAAPAAAQDFTDPDVFAADFLGCVVDAEIGDCVEEVLENAGLEDEEGTFVTTDATPFNPVDDEGSVTTEFEDDVLFPSEVEETEE